MQAPYLKSQASKTSKLSVTTSTTQLQQKALDLDQLSLTQTHKNPAPNEILPHPPSQRLSTSAQKLELRLRKQCDDYRNLLISENELDIKLLEQDKQKRGLEHKILINKKQPFRLNQQIIKVKGSLDKINQRIIKCQQSLKGKFRETKPWKVASQTELGIKRSRQYQIARKSTITSMKSFRGDPNNIKQDIDKEKEWLKSLRNKFQMEQQKTMKKLLEKERQKVNRFRKESIERIKVEYRKLEKEMEYLRKNKSQYIELNQNLEYLLTVEQQHENSCIIIERAMILKENEKVINYTFQMETANEIQTNLIPNLEMMLGEVLQSKKEIATEVRKAQQSLDHLSEILQSMIHIHIN